MRLDLRALPSARVLEATVQLVDRPALTQSVKALVAAGKRALVANHNLHSLYLLRQGLLPGEFYNLAAVTHIDGMGLAALGRLLSQPVRARHVVTYIDWFPELLSMAASNHLRVFYLGSKPGIAEEGLRRLSSEFPGLRYECEHGFFDTSPGSEESTRVLDRIRLSNPHLLFVGMGMPRQERWILQEWRNLPPAVIFDCGACIDYFADVQRMQPGWARRAGLGWLFRLVREPGRLWRRYLVEPMDLVGPVIREMGRRRGG